MQMKGARYTFRAERTIGETSLHSVYDTRSVTIRDNCTLLAEQVCLLDTRVRSTQQPVQRKYTWHE